MHHDDAARAILRRQVEVLRVDDLGYGTVDRRQPGDVRGREPVDDRLPSGSLSGVGHHAIPWKRGGGTFLTDRWLTGASRFGSPTTIFIPLKGRHNVGAMSRTASLQRRGLRLRDI